MFLKMFLLLSLHINNNWVDAYSVHYSFLEVDAIKNSGSPMPKTARIKYYDSFLSPSAFCLSGTSPVLAFKSSLPEALFSTLTWFFSSPSPSPYLPSRYNRSLFFGALQQWDNSRIILPLHPQSVLHPPDSSGAIRQGKIWHWGTRPFLPLACTVPVNE